MIISPKHRFIFFKPMKTAGSSVEYSLIQNCGPNALATGCSIIDHGSQANSDKDIEWEYEPRNNTNDDWTLFHTHTYPSIFCDRMKNLELYKNYRWISMTRNPWDAMVSYFFYSIAQDRETFSKLKRKLKQNPIAYSSRIKKLFRKYMIQEPMIMTSIKVGQKNPPMTALEYLSSCNESHVDDKISNFIRFENLKKDYNLLCFLLGIEPIELKKFKSNSRLLKHHYSWYYNEESIKLVEDAFPKTIEKFGYEFERRVK